MKIKPLLPSLREKKRYLAFEVLSEHNINQDKIMESIEESSSNLMGELETGKAGIQLVDEIHNNKGILRVNNKYLDKLKTSLLLVKEINNKKVIIKSNKVSGILKKVKNGGK